MVIAMTSNKPRGTGRIYPNTCHQCGTDFMGWRRTQRSCGTQCRDADRITPWQERFWKYLTPGDPAECWEWHGARDHRGYGRIQRGGQNGGLIKAHRASYELHVGPIPDGLVICHHCDNPPCCNPAHLFAGTQRDNGQDMSRKRRAPAHKPGYRNPREGLSDEAVREIRERAARGELYIVLARDYGVRSQWISEVVRGNRRQRAGGPLSPWLNHAQRRARRSCHEKSNSQRGGPT